MQPPAPVAVQHVPEPEPEPEPEAAAGVTAIALYEYAAFFPYLWLQALIACA